MILNLLFFQPPAAARASPPPQSSAASPSRGDSANSGQNGWLSAEQEKLQLFQQAQAAVVRTQGVAGAPPPASVSTHARNNSDPKSSGTGSKPSAADLYSEAMRNRTGGSSSLASPTKPGVPYLTAEQEKAALRRYEEAKRAVDRTQNSTFSGGDGAGSSGSAPVAYDSLYPTTPKTPPATASSHPPPTAADLPPSFDVAAGPGNIMAHLSEKERLRREYEARDAAVARQNQTPPPPAAYSSPPPPAAYSSPPVASGPSTPAQYTSALEEKEALKRKFEARDNARAAAQVPPQVPVPAPAPTPGPPTPGQYTSALEEKEALRRKFEARDNAQKVQTVAPPQPPPRFNDQPPAFTDGPSSPSQSPNAAASSFRPTPLPPASGSSRVLTAAEEKALLKAKYEARDGGRKTTQPITNGGTSNSNGPSSATPSTPPPLMPRPPVEYIKETQEEDARLSRFNGEAPTLDDVSSLKMNGASSSKPPSGVNALDMKPFTPFRAGFDASIPPPLPTTSGE